MDATQRLNKTYSQVKIGGKVRIWDGQDFLAQRDFVALEAGNGEWIEDNKGKKKLVEDTAVWLKSKDRNLYRKTTFYPGEVPDDTFNLWQGWPVEPKQGQSYNLFKKHLTENICNGRRDYAKWLWRWMAQIVQHPEEKLGTAVALRGLKGSGKGIFADILGTLCQNNYRTLADGDRVTGRFNSVYERTLLCCLDEAFWAGNKKGEGVLKNLITARTLDIERKGLESYSVPNFTRFILTTNSDWIIPATWDERRYFVLDVQDHWIKDKVMFGAMMKQMERGGYAGLMYDLLHTTLDEKINLRTPLMTDALKDQIRLSEPAMMQWWRRYVGELGMEWNGVDWSRKLEDDLTEYCRPRPGAVPSWQSFLNMLKRSGVLYEKNRRIKTVGGKQEIQLTFNIESVLQSIK